LEHYIVKKVPRVRGEKEAKALCLYDCVSTYANYVHSDYELMFLGMLKFSYENAESVSNNIHRSKGIGSIEIKSKPLEDLETYHGITVTLREVNLNEIRERQKSHPSLKEPTVIVLDNYWCYWDKSYMRFHSTNEGHAAFVLDIRDNGDWVLTDPYDNKEDIVVSNSDVESGYMYHYVLDCKNITFEKERYIRAFRDELIRQMTMKYQDMLLQIANELKNGFSFDEELDENISDVYQMELYQKISYLRDSHEDFVVVINYIKRLLNSSLTIFDETADLFIQQAKIYNVSLVIITKAFMLRDDSIIRDRLSGKFYEAANHQVKIYENLQQMVDIFNSI